MPDCNNCCITDFELLSKASMLLELVFIADGCFTFNNSSYRRC